MSVLTREATKVVSATSNRKRWDSLVPYLFIMPFLISFIVFFLFPSVYSFILSFYRYKGYGNATFVGLDNYIALMKYPTFWQSVENTLFYLIVHIVPVMVVAFMLAVIINSKRLKGKSIYKPIIFLPQITAVVASALIFKVIFATRSGVINSLFGTEIFFLEDAGLMRWTVVSLVIWRSIGWFFVIYLAGLTTVSEEVQEAAIIDGATPLKRLRYITIPLMKPIFMFAFMIDTIGSLKIYTEPFLLFSTGLSAPPEVVPVLGILTMNINGGNFGMASAVGWILFVMILIVSLLQYKVFRGGESE